MMKTEKVWNVPDWSKRQVNRWTDYVELRCLLLEDHLVTRDDVLDFLLEKGMEELLRGESSHSEKYDKVEADVDTYFEMIEYRDRHYKEFYPFEVEDGQCIFLKHPLTETQMHYIFLLLCSSVSFIDRSFMQKITHTFEAYCCPIMKQLMPVDAETELFGTARESGRFQGNLRSRIKILADCLGAQTTKTMDSDRRYDSVHGGDAGLDLVSFVKLDHASHIPFALGQCTCSYDHWIDKQPSINRGAWRSKMEPLAPFWRFLFVPFSCHNALGRFEQATEIHTCLIDRQRILHILQSHCHLLEEMRHFKLGELLREAW